MTDIVEKVKSERNLFEKITSYIPGYRGYKEKELRRESDRLVRQQASTSLKKASDAFKRSLGSAASLSEAKRLQADRVISRLDLAKEKVAKASSGYSGLFDAVKVGEGRLDQMIRLDYELVSLSEGLAEQAEKVRREGVLSPTWGQRLEGMDEGIGKVEDLLGKRDELLSQPQEAMIDAASY